VTIRKDGDFETSSNQSGSIRTFLSGRGRGCTRKMRGKKNPEPEYWFWGRSRSREPDGKVEDQKNGLEGNNKDKDEIVGKPKKKNLSFTGVRVSDFTKRKRSELERRQEEGVWKITTGKKASSRTKQGPATDAKKEALVPEGKGPATSGRGSKV